MKTIFLTLSVCCAVLGLMGCTSTIDDHHTLSTSFLNDTMEARYERSLSQVWKAAKDALSANGRVTVEDVIGNIMQAQVDTHKVWLKAESITPTQTRILIQVRTKGGGTDLRLAGELDKQIALRLATGNLTPTTGSALPPAK